MVGEHWRVDHPLPSPDPGGEPLVGKILLKQDSTILNNRDTEKQVRMLLFVFGEKNR